MKKPPSLDKSEWLQLRMLASNTTERFSSPVYLVGSAITKKDPGDYDILLVVTDDMYRRIIGDPKKMQQGYIDQKPNREYARKIRFIKKQKAYFDKHFWGKDFDFKIVMWDQFKAHPGEKLRLDCFEGIF